MIIEDAACQAGQGTLYSRDATNSMHTRCRKRHSSFHKYDILRRGSASLEVYRVVIYYIHGWNCGRWSGQFRAAAPFSSWTGPELNSTKTSLERKISGDFKSSRYHIRYLNLC